MRQAALEIARGYAALLFCANPWIGALFAAVTFASPSGGALGLLGAASAYAAGRLLGLSAPAFLLACNGALIGLCYGFFYRAGLSIVGATLLSGAFTALLAQVLGAWLHRLGKLPLLSLPFALCAWLTLPALKGLESAVGYAQPLAPGTLVAPAIDGFFLSLAAFLFQSEPWIGAVLFAGLLVSSRYLAACAIAGYAAGAACLAALGVRGIHPEAVGFNFTLTAMALGGVFLVPSWAAFGFSLLAVCLCAVLAGALAAPFAALGSAPFVAPFLLTVLVCVAALGLRSARQSPSLNPDPARLPEETFEATRLARVRNGEALSVPLLVPFYGEWQVSQGFSGPHTHRGEWRHAVDFVMAEEGRTFRGSGAALAEFHCFGASVVAPASGTVIALRDDLPDNAPGELGPRDQNWGNHILLALANGCHVLLGHLRCRSALVQPGQWVAAGQPLAACGNSGRSSQPHLHVHVQSGAALGSPTVPFHFCAVLARAGGESDAYFRLTSRPEEGEAIAGAVADARLASCMHLAAGRWLRFETSEDGRAAGQRELQVEVTLLGQFRLGTPMGASAAFEQTYQVLAFYDRKGPPEPLLDAWLLAVGMTPFSAAATVWADAADARSFPVRLGERIALALVGPFGVALRSTYRRIWSEAHEGWRQDGAHELLLAGVVCARASTQAWLAPGVGVREILCTRGTRTYRATLAASGVRGDYGIPEITHETAKGE